MPLVRCVVHSVRVNTTGWLVLLCAAAVGAAAWQARGLLTAADPGVRDVPVIDMETGTRHALHIDGSLEGWPAPCPGTGRATCYPAEACRRGACGAAGGTWVVLNETLGRAGPTYCPVCGHPVWHNNAPPEPGDVALDFGGEDGS